MIPILMGLLGSMGGHCLGLEAAEFEPQIYGMLIAAVVLTVFVRKLRRDNFFIIFSMATLLIISN
jgi:hypothetical protein